MGPDRLHTPFVLPSEVGGAQGPELKHGCYGGNRDPGP